MAKSMRVSLVAHDKVVREWSVTRYEIKEIFRNDVMSVRFTTEQGENVRAYVSPSHTFIVENVD